MPSTSLWLRVAARFRLVAGATRQLSVRAGLEALAVGSAPEIVLVHDAARPYVDAALIAAVARYRAEHGGKAPRVLDIGSGSGLLAMMASAFWSSTL